MIISVLSTRDVMCSLMVDEEQGEVAAALSRLARRYFGHFLKIQVRE